MGDLRTTQGEDHPLPQKEQRIRRIRFIIITLLILIAIFLIGAFVPVPRYTLAEGYTTTLDWCQVTPPAAGQVKKVHVRTGARIEKNALLVELDDTIEQTNLAEAKAQLDKIKLDIVTKEAELDNDIDKRRTSKNKEIRDNLIAIDNAQNKCDSAKTDITNAMNLIEKELTNRDSLKAKIQVFRNAELELISSKQRDISLRLELELIARDEEKNQKLIQALRQQITSQQERINRLEALLDQKKIRAPQGGYVIKHTFEEGENLLSNQVIYEIYDGKPELKIKIPEKYATKVKVGDKYRAELKSYEGLKSTYFYGEVVYLKPAIQTDGNNSYRGAFCSFDPAEYNIPFGTTCEARVYYAKSSLWFFIFGLDWE
ncbi:MAG: efflux RND transporter periplasmic adaptor subunit [Victivallales bacterium]|nr:efflux RND transporter periplasmic adaptor subunit [Victivallales bacterium]